MVLHAGLQVHAATLSLELLQLLGISWSHGPEVSTGFCRAAPTRAAW